MGKCSFNEHIEPRTVMSELMKSISNRNNSSVEITRQSFRSRNVGDESKAAIAKPIIVCEI